MTDDTETSRLSDGKKQPPVHLRLPGFVSDEDIGLGDAIMRATGYLGIKPCGGCQKRAAALNRRVVFTR